MKLKIVEVVVHQVAQQFTRSLDVALRYDRQDIERHVAGTQQIERMQHFAMRGASARVVAVGVVPIRRTVNADPDEKAVVVQELRPIIVEQRPVRLQCVGDRYRAAVARRVGYLPLDDHRLAEEVQPHQRRLTALPVEGQHRADRGVLLAERAERLDGERRVVLPGVDFLLFEVEAVRTA